MGRRRTPEISRSFLDFVDTGEFKLVFNNLGCLEKAVLRLVYRQVCNASDRHLITGITLLPGSSAMMPANPR